MPPAHRLRGAPAPRGKRVLARLLGWTQRPEGDIGMSLSLPDAASERRLPEPDGLGSLARVMHELRTPLLAMGLTAELLCEDLDHLARPDVRQLVATLHRNSVWLHQLVENLHEFAAPGRAPEALAGVPVDLGAVLHETEHIIRPVLTAKGQRLDMLAP